MISTRGLLNKDVVFSVIIFLISGALLVMPNLYDSPFSREEDRYVGEVVEVDNSLIQQYGIVKAGSQRMKVRLLEGPYKGQVIAADNDLIGKMESDKMFATGDQAIVVVTISGNEIIGATAYDHYRLKIEGVLVILFAALLIAFTGWVGAKALLSFIFAILVMWKILLPGILRGYDPIWMALMVVTAISGVTLFLVAGVNRTALAAWLGAFLGILLTASLALLLYPSFLLHGAIQPFSETLLYSGFESLDLGRLFIAAIFLGASGAVIDVAIDVAAAMREVARKRPDLSRKELTRSGFTVGRAMVSTMVTTLLMAYVSGYMALLMVLLSKGIPAAHILNLNFIAAEIMKTVIGSFGLVTVAPFTAIVGGILFVKWRHAHGTKTEFAISQIPPV
ncbi:MAG: YibE/F family protein [Thermodesulfobacteriota bacterium]